MHHHSAGVRITRTAQATTLRFIAQVYPRIHGRAQNDRYPAPQTGPVRTGAELVGVMYGAGLRARPRAAAGRYGMSILLPSAVFQPLQQGAEELNHRASDAASPPCRGVQLNARATSPPPCTFGINAHAHRSGIRMTNGHGPDGSRIIRLVGTDHPQSARS